MTRLLAGFTFVVILGISNTVQAGTISVDAMLSRADLSVANPIDFNVLFPKAFVSIDQLTMDAYWVDDGLDPGEGVSYSGGLGGYSNFGPATQFFRRLTYPASLGFGFVLDQFLDGTFDGSIFGDTGTTVRFERLVFTVEGEPVPELSTLLLCLTGVLALPIALRRRSETLW